MADRHSIAMILLERMGLAPRAEHLFSREDENFRNHQLENMAPDDLAYTDKLQRQMWRDQFMQQAPQAWTTAWWTPKNGDYPARLNPWLEGAPLSRMPEVGSDRYDVPYAKQLDRPAVRVVPDPFAARPVPRTTLK